MLDVGAVVDEHLEDRLRRRRDLAHEGEAGHPRQATEAPSAADRFPRPRSTSPRIVRWSRQERTICSTQALTGVLTFSAPTISPTISKAVFSPSASEALHFADQLLDLAPRLGDLRLGVAEGAAVAGQDEVDLERLDLVEAAEELADRVGGVAVVEEEDGAAEQVVAGDQQPALGLVEDDVRGRVAGRLVDLPGAEVGLDLDPGQQVAVGLDDRVDPGLVVAAARLAVALQRRRRDAALAGDLDPLLERRGGVVGHQAARAPRPGASRARSRPPRRSAPPARSGRCGSGCRRAGARPRPRSRPGRARGRSWRMPALAADPGVEEDDAAVGGDRPDVAVRDAGPGQRQAQPPDARQHLFAARRLRPLALAHRPHPLRTGRPPREDRQPG